MSMKTRDQKHLATSELETAIEFAEIARSYDVPLTLFLTGRCAVEESDQSVKLGAVDGVEIGGHNYFAYSLPILGGLPYRAHRKLFGVDSPAPFQAWEVRRTRYELEQIAGSPVVSWRDHGYRHDKNTRTILAKNGIRYFSDDVTPERDGPYRSEVLTEVPINVLPDHEHLYHGYRTTEYVADRDWENKFTDQSFHPEEWLELAIEQTGQIIDRGGVATILAHPACMKIADEFEVFERLCSFLAAQETMPMRALPQR